MIHENITLPVTGVTLTTYVQDDIGTYGTEHGRKAILIFPGGAYAFLSPFEAEPLAMTFLAKGFNCFILHYTTGDACKYPNILIEASEAIKTIRDNADKWHINPHQIIPMGFSAGACLAGMCATQWNAPEISEALHAKPEELRPDAAVIAYGCWDNSGTIWNDPAFRNPGASNFPKSCPPQLDLINYVGEHVCPLFIWHNQNDKYVPVRNCLMITEKMCELHIPVELHLYTGGEHGMSVANPLIYNNKETKELVEANPNVQLWTTMCTNWLNEVL